jgi:hypothetical protein
MIQTKWALSKPKVLNCHVTVASERCIPWVKVALRRWRMDEDVKALKKMRTA